MFLVFGLEYDYFVYYQCQGDGDWIEQLFVDQVGEQDVEDYCWEECDQQVGGEMLGLVLVWQVMDDLKDFFLKFLDDSEDCCQLDDDVECFGVFVVEVDEVGDDDLVFGVGNWQEFGQFFYDVQDECLESSLLFYVFFFFIIVLNEFLLFLVIYLLFFMKVL